MRRADTKVQNLGKLSRKVGKEDRSNAAGDAVIAENYFCDKSVKPDGEALSKALEDSYVFWQAIRKDVEDSYGKATEDWKFYSPNYGWTLKLLLKKRNLFFFVATKGGFRMAFVFGDKAVGVIEKSNLPKNIIEEIKNARKYVEGRGLRLEVKDAKSVEVVKKLIKIKVEN